MKNYSINKIAYYNLSPTIGNISTTGTLGLLLCFIYTAIGVGMYNLTQLWR